MLPVEARSFMPWNARSAASMASKRVSIGLRFHRSQRGHTTQSLPLAASNASRRPTGNCSSASLRPSRLLQKRQAEYIGPKMRRARELR